MAVWQIKLTDKYQAAQHTTSYVFEKPVGFSYLPGQHMVVQLDFPTAAAEETLRDMSLASAPTEDSLVITMRQGTSKFKLHLAKMRPGDTVKMYGPVGRFVLPASFDRPIVMLAGGIGITPFRSMLRYLADKNLVADVTLIFSNSTVERIAFKEEIVSLSQPGVRRLKLKLVLTLTSQPPVGWFGERGRITRAMIPKHITDMNNSLFYVCGPTSMVHETKQLLLAMQLTPAQIKTEEFTGY